MTKIQILTTCSQCNGQAYLPVGDALSSTGETYIRHVPCRMCNGTGQNPKWIGLREFAQLLAQINCPHTHTSSNGGFYFNEGEVWDDIQEECVDCGAKLH